MKKTFFAIALLAITTLSNASGEYSALPEMNVNYTTTVKSVYSGKFIKSDAAVTGGTEVTEVIRAYLQLKDALVADNGQLAAESAATLARSLDQLGKELKDPSAIQAYNKDGKAAIKDAEVIGNTQALKSQRKSFGSLSDHLYKLIKVTGAPASLYLDYCPMAKATWLSDKEPIENPYYGKSMLTCGSVKETIEQKTK